MEGPLVTRIPDQKIALRGVRLRSVVAALAERTVVEQTFVNREPQAIEAIYTFPLPEEAAVCHFEVITGDRVLTGIVEENEKAIENYEAAIGRGDAAYLLEQERPDVFTITVGNINPRQAATVRLTYVRPVKVVDRQIRLAFPTTVAPRYVTATGSADPLEAQIDGDAVNPPHAMHVPYGMSFEVELNLGAGVTSINSPSHAVRVQELEDHRRRITFAGGVGEMNRDVVIDVRLAREQKPGIVLVKGDGGRGAGQDQFLAVTFMPEFDVAVAAVPEPSETVFVLDCSGSMQGESIEQATRALELCLRSLGEGDAFNICRFGSSFELMRPEPVRYRVQTLRDALAWIRRPADLGGTELFPALEAILQVPPVMGRLRNVVLLTDGEVSNEPDVIALARRHRAQNRVFSFGIGASASAHLVNGVARATGGAAEFISAGERIDEKVLRTFGRMASPTVSDVEIEWGEADVQTLAEIPPLFDGDAVAVYGRILGSPPSEVTLKCRLSSNGSEKKWVLPVGQVVPDEAGIVATMWARRAIQSSEEVNGVRRTSARLREQSRDRERLIALSKQFNLVCSLTSFIAVEHRTLEERNDGRPAVRRVPVMLARGWGSAPALCCIASVPMARRRPVSFRDAVASEPPAGVGSVNMDRMLDLARDPEGDLNILGDLHEPANRSSSRAIQRTMDRTIDRHGDVVADFIASGGSDKLAAAALLAHLVMEGLTGAADRIEFEPGRLDAKVVLVSGKTRRELVTIPTSSYESLTRLVKRCAGMEASQTQQGGSLTFEIGGHPQDIKAVVTPLGSGSESLRIELPAAHGGFIAAIQRKLHKPKVRFSEPTARLMDLLVQQAADGSFESGCGAGNVGTGQWVELRNELEVLAPGKPAALTPLVMSTAIALVSMQLIRPVRREMWQRAHAKGCRFVANALGVQPHEVAAVLDRLAQKLSPPPSSARAGVLQ